MIERTELIFGMVGPIGCPIHEAELALIEALRRVEYDTHSISLSASMDGLLSERGIIFDDLTSSNLANKIAKGNAVRRVFKNDSVLAADAIQQIRNIREINLSNTETSDDIQNPLKNTAFFIRQLKRPEEVALLQKVFGKRFIQISVVAPTEQRHDSLTNRLLSEQYGWSNVKCTSHASELITQDQDEKSDVNGQKISKIFHLADVFLDGRSADRLRTSSDRFVSALFGRTDISPTRDEHGSYFAKAASLRSVDLSRQVGAAITSEEGDIISIGCNEVPRPGGGNHWDTDEEKRRDVDLGGEANRREVNRIVHDFLDLLSTNKLLVENADAESILGNDDLKKKIKKSLIGGITEYGRMVHAEMNALCDAARLGRSLKSSTIYVTTYPCHNCAKHLVAAGIARIVFIEPYPKSKATSLFKNIVITDSDRSDLVSLEHFYGISPKRFRDIFEKESRQEDTGEVQEWYEGVCAPRLGAIAFGPTNVAEIFAIRDNLYNPESYS